MQDKTINNALIALAKQGGSQAKLADVLLDMRGVEWNGWVQDNPFKRGGTKRIVMDALRGGPQTSWQLGEAIRALRPEIGPDAAYNRAYQALKRLKDKGLVRRDGRLWGLAQ